MFTILGADGKEYGPVTADKIREWITAGRANAHTSIKRVGEADWTTIAALVEFNPGIAAAIPPLPAAVAPAPMFAPAAAAPAMAAAPAAGAVAGAELPSRWLRLGSAILDGIISSFIMLPGFGILFAAGFLNRPHQQPNTPLLIAGFCALGVGFLIVLGIQIYLLTTRGQTMGKKLLGLRIVRFDDGSNPGFVKAFVLRAFVNGLIGAVPGLGPVYSLVDLCFIFRDDRRCLHDLIAGTVVVKA